MRLPADRGPRRVARHHRPRCIRANRPRLPRHRARAQDHARASRALDRRPSHRLTREHLRADGQAHREVDRLRVRQSRDLAGSTADRGRHRRIRDAEHPRGLDRDPTRAHDDGPAPDRADLRDREVTELAGKLEQLDWISFDPQERARDRCGCAAADLTLRRMGDRAREHEPRIGPCPRKVVRHPRSTSDPTDRFTSDYATIVVPPEPGSRTARTRSPGASLPRMWIAPPPWSTTAIASSSFAIIPPVATW